MAKLTYRNERGDTLIFGDKAPFLITKIDGLGSPQNQVFRNKSPNQDGTSYTSMNLDERNIVLEGVILESDRLLRQQDRDRLTRVFNPKLEGELTFERDGKIKKIDCIVEQGPDFPSNMQENYQMFMISLLCPDPFFTDIEERREEIAVWQPAFEFPLDIPEEGIEMGYREPSLIVNIENKGDVESGMRIVFRANATVTNPSLFNVNTREYFKINKTMEAGEIITVTTHFQNKRVELNKNGVISNAFNWIDLYSTFLQLDVGDNLLRYDAETGLDNLEVDIYHSPQYLGV